MRPDLFRQLFLLILLWLVLPQKGSAKPGIVKHRDLSASAARWIAPATDASQPNTWMACRKTFNLGRRPASVMARIAADSKYWLWVNGKMLVFEGGLKRGPDPENTYTDQADLAPYLKTGSNVIAVLVCYFGKEGFSHKSSGRAGLFFEAAALPEVNSNQSWKCQVLPAYQTAAAPLPNYRLPESSILYDARKATDGWQTAAFNDSTMPRARELGPEGSAPWNRLLPRPIPLFRDFGLKAYPQAPAFPFVSKGDTIVCNLPYNAQVTPYLEIEAPEAGRKISMFTDNYLLFLKGEVNLRSEYITRKGRQHYESLGWINGHKMYYVIPEGIRVLGLKYRETGYDTELSGSFSCDHAFLNQLWQKAQRTLYLNMRDSYMDCPERERAQWTGDAVNESGQAFYALSPSSHALGRKWLHELVAWQKKDSSLFAPAPAGNWDKELPDQSMASIGYYGLWNYYLHTGDRQTLRDVYDGARRYLLAWKLNDQGTVIFRPGGWTWGDWGDNRDMLLLYNLWYYLGLKGMQLTAAEIGRTEDAATYDTLMQRFALSFNRQFWNGSAYRDPAYKGRTDDRTQALAILSGIAGEEKYPALLKVFQTEAHASPYMEKYVFEAMFVMGQEKEALERHEKRFRPMVSNPRFTTLFEVWEMNDDGTGNGTVNHAWSGGGLTVLSQYLSGVAPLKPGYTQFQVKPQPGPLQRFDTNVPSRAGNIKVSWKQDGSKQLMTLTVPRDTEAFVTLPGTGYQQILLNGKAAWKKGDARNPFGMLRLKGGSWKIEAS
ncbi:alpha-L-rhamnosidase C-terminal domain-containing protein [Pedobacter sp. JY14-1]|uniref:alpha-L-rhamnosidase-related protein n=1 Tax=Pedobacter sp. JY14-1 TaxID=3034151 RepID=UPI0023E0DB3F|nr:alpha-L-rhamnosidase C-terminal domain-containing protein [Pedobacter sp. JY14-1]